MGRTSRKRSRSTSKNGYSLNNSEDWIAFMTFLKKHSFTPSKYLVPAQFVRSGRGIKTLKGIRKGETVLSIPRQLLITPNLVDTAEYHQLKEFKGSQKLTCFLLLEKQMNEASVWFPYISGLPKDFSFHPVWKKIPPDLIHLLPGFMANEIICFYERVESDYHDVEHILKGLTSLSSEELYQEYLWAWICVNSRSVYCDVGGSNDRQNCCALIPFLDLLNHSCSVETNAFYSHQDECFCLTTNTTFRKYDEVLICYGNHPNLNLYLEYGFTLEDNNNNALIFKISDLLNLFRRMNISVDKSQYVKFTELHNLSRNLFINEEGVSWSLEKLIMLLNANHVDHQQLLYGEQISNGTNHFYLCVVRSLIMNLLQDVNNALDALDYYGKLDLHPCISNIMRILADFKIILEGHS